MVFIIAVLLITNSPWFDFFLQENFTYANGDGSFTYSEESGKGKSFQGCLITYGYFLCAHPQKAAKDRQLYRTFTIKPWRVWEWRQFLFYSERFKLPYKNVQ
jgi:hypothetical protein